MDNKTAKIISNLTKVIISLCLIILALLLFLTYILIDTKQEEENKAWCGTVTYIDSNFPSSDIFNSNCKSCHHLNKQLIGPALSGVLQRLPSEEWFDTFIRDQDTLIHHQNSYVLTLLNQDTNYTFIHRFKHFSYNNLEELKDYLK